MKNTDHPYVLEINHLTKSYSSYREEKTIIHQLDLSVKEHEFVCILGPSGCGKTTLLRCIAGFETYSGEIKIDGQTKTSPSTERIMVFQDFNQLFPWKTVKKNIMFSLKQDGHRSRQKIAELTEHYLGKVNLSDYKNYYPFQLSGGMKQRVAIAKSLALNPKIILMDEPFASLDAISRRSLQNELLRINESEKMTTIFITHNIQEALILGTRIIVLGKMGQVLTDTENHLQKPVTPASPKYSYYWQLLYDALQNN